MTAFVAVVSLLVSVVLLPIPGGVVFAPFAFGLFLLALAGVLAGSDRPAGQPERAADPRRGRPNGS
jgi:hypothetical protein